MFALLSLSMFVVVTAFAGGNALEGLVKDAGGKPLKNAEVKIEPRAGSYFSKVTKTDANGHYSVTGLASGEYKVTLSVNGKIKAQILNATANSTKVTQLNFDLRTAKVPVKTHRVWVAAETGTHIGNGRWVTVDENGNPVDEPGANNVENLNGSAMKPTQSNIGVVHSPGGH